MEKMLSKHLTWVFVGLFVLFGALVFASESAPWRRFWAGLSMLTLGGFAFSFVRDALTTGQMRVQYSVIRYAAQPRLFWATVVLVVGAGVVVVIGGLWVLFFKG